ncbi:MAG TPA: hypothetical protein VMR98_00165 [Candidatus Polarisedimenticolaceae bacterium]|nr:hypothetical protein [Candidatus Polarisedimenticolaceae bacterium]
MQPNQNANTQPAPNQLPPSERISSPTPEQQPAPAAPETAPNAPQSAPQSQPVQLPQIPDVPAQQVPGAPAPDPLGPALPAPPVPATPNPIVANDTDVIEKEWVDQANKIIEQTKNDPYVEEEAVEALQVDYLKKRYGHEVKKPDA